MNLYVQLPVRAEEKEYLLSKLPESIDAVFEIDITEATRAENIKKAEIVFGNPPAELLEAAENLRWIQLHSVGFDKYQNLKSEAQLTNMKGFYAQPCAETAVGGVLAFYRKMDWLGILRSRNEWVGQSLRMEMSLLRRKKVLILGTGSIAQACRKILSGFDCEVAFFGRSNPEARFRTPEEIIEGIGEFEVVINTLPGTEQTARFVSAEMIARMHPSAVFANVGRGSTVDEPALVQALLNGDIAGAVLDVTEQEPLPNDHPLWDCPNVILSQHSGGGYAEEFKDLIDIFLNNLQKFLANEPLDNPIDPQKGY